MALGNGDTRYEAFFDGLQRTFPGRAVSPRGHNQARALDRGRGDLFLMPSRYEPCDLNEMYSLRYGTVPVVRNTGGLADSVQKYDPDFGERRGSCSTTTTPGSRVGAHTALEWYEWPDL